MIKAHGGAAVTGETNLLRMGQHQLPELAPGVLAVPAAKPGAKPGQHSARTEAVLNQASGHTPRHGTWILVFQLSCKLPQILLVNVFSMQVTWNWFHLLAT